MKAKRFNLATILCALFSAAFLSVGIVFTAPAKATDVTGEQAQSIFVMDEGASVRIGEEGTANVNGLKFTASMTDANYQGLFGENGSVGEGKTYASATFGMLIAPASYAGLNYANVFGQEAIYGWSLVDEETGEWLPYEGEKIEIINIYNQKLYQVVDAVSGVISWEFRGGSITNLIGEWIATDFQGLAYVELVKNDGTGCDYIMANAGQIANMYEVAVKSYYDANSELTVEDKAWIKANYIDVASEAIATDIGLTPATSIDLSEYGLPAGEYDFYIQQYIEKTNSANNSSPFIAFKDYIGEKVAATVDGTVVDTSSLEGTYQITAAFSGTDYGYTFYVDRYTEGTFVWNNVFDVTESVRVTDTWGSNLHVPADVVAVSKVDKENDPVTAGRAGDYYRVDSTYTKLNTAANGSPVGFNIYPVHSKEYYATLFAGKNIILDYYFTKIAEDGTVIEDANKVRWQFNIPMGANSTVDWIQPSNSWTHNPGSWGTRSASSIDQIVNVWDRFIANKSSDHAELLIGFKNAVDTGTSAEIVEPHTGAVVWYFGNVHLTSDAMSYKEVAYDLEGNEIATTTKSASLGSTVTYVPEYIAGYNYVESNVNNFLTGTVLGNNTLTLKAYYAPVTSEDLSNGFTTIIKDNSYSFVNKVNGNVVGYTVQQYVVRDLGNDGVIDYVPVDVTDDFVNAITDNVLDMTSFDGIFTVTAFVEDGSGHAVTFERMIDGVFTYNSINEVGHEKVVGANVSHTYLESVYTGTAVIEAAPSSDTFIAGRSGNYYKSTFDVATASKSIGWKIYPTHTKAYFEQFLENGEVYYVVDNALEKSTTKSWNVYHGLGLGYNDLAYSDLGLYYWQGGLMYDGLKVAFNDSKLNAYGQNQMRKLSGLVKGWNSLLKEGTGANMIGVNATNSDTATTATIYIGNIHILPVYTTNYYVQQDDGSYTLHTTTQNDSKSAAWKNVAFGTKINAKTDYAIDGYAYAPNENEKLTTIVGIYGDDLNVYYNKTTTYDIEIYLQNAEGGFDYSAEYSSTDVTVGIGAYISYSPITIDGYLFNRKIEGSVLEGTATADNKVVLKAYYIRPVTVDEDLSAELRSDPYFDFGSTVGDVESFTITQHLIKANTTNNLDVTYLYNGSEEGSTSIMSEDGVMDMTKLDGIFTINVIGNLGTYKVKLEQVVEGVYTWNNVIPEIYHNPTKGSSSYTKGALLGCGNWNGEMNWAYRSMLTTTKLDPSEGRDGYYYTYSYTGDNDQYSGLKVFPVHSYKYYTEYVPEGYQVTFDIKYTTTEGTFPLAIGRGFGDSIYSGYQYPSTNRWYTYKLNLSVLISEANWSAKTILNNGTNHWFDQQNGGTVPKTAEAQIQWWVGNIQILPAK